ncbi:MAG: transposase [Calditrichaeota bacterium]|nr:transposase [Calditrichota bacterium]MCB0305105.1 transposase [Calditrichota bacterium]
MHTPIKKKKGQQTELDYLQKLFSTAVSSVRQPIESLFNWLDQKTGIQTASKVRSYQGLITHVFGRLTAAMLCLVFNL